MPEPGDDTPYTLLFKESYIRHLYKSNDLGKAQTSYSFAGTRDACSTRAKIPLKHSYRRSGIAFVQHYNVAKEPLSTMLHKHSSFSLSDLEALGVRSQLLDEWIKGSTREHTFDKTRLNSIFTKTCHRLQTSVQDGSRRSYGIRTELRINYHVLATLPDTMPTAERRHDSTPHPPFFSLASDDAFGIRHSVGVRLTCAIQYIVARRRQNETAKVDIDYRAAAAEAAMVALLFRVLRLAVNDGIPSLINSL